MATAFKTQLEADVGFMNGGGVRGNNSYSDFLTLANLMELLPFKSEIYRIPLPGSVLRDAFQYSRSDEMTVGGENTAMWHPSKGVLFDKHNKIYFLGGKSLELHKKYDVVLDKFILNGGDNIEPLLEYLETGKNR
eukprot:UN07550